jgi:hypothetical protein
MIEPVNTRQKRVLIVCAVVAALMVVVPPWTHTTAAGALRDPKFIESSGGYHLAFAPPDTEYGEAYNVNLGLLALQELVLVVVAGAVFRVVKD